MSILLASAGERDLDTSSERSQWTCLPLLRIFFARPAAYLSQVQIDQQWANMDFPDRSLKKNLRPMVVEAFEVSKQTHRNHAAQQHNAAPGYVSWILPTMQCLKRTNNIPQPQISLNPDRHPAATSVPFSHPQCFTPLSIVGPFLLVSPLL
jgi:hypothetical protein